VTTMVEAPTAPASRAARSHPGHHGRATWAMARFEGRRLLRHPLFVLGAIVSVGLFGFVTWKAAPVLQADAILIGGCLLPTAAMTLLAANLAVLRSHRHGTDELYDGLATTRGLSSAGGSGRPLRWSLDHRRHATSATASCPMSNR